MDTRKHSIYRWLLSMVAIAALCGMPQRLTAQERKVQNRPYIDMRRWHYGFLFGVHMQDLEFTNNGYIHTLEDGMQESWFADVASYTPGFSVGVLGELRLTEYLALRFIPTLIEETDKIMKAQQARCTDFDEGNLAKRITSLIPVLVPLFISAVRRANDLAMAMEARCYRGGTGRTKMKPLVYTKTDYMAYLIMLIYIIIWVAVKVWL